MKKNIEYIYHHFGIPTTDVRPNERYSSKFKMYTTSGDNPFCIQWHRFEADSPLHPLLKTQPHVAFKVKDLEAAIDGEMLTLEPYSPFNGFRVAVIETEGAVIELIETSLNEEEIWSTSNKAGTNLYPDSD